MSDVDLGWSALGGLAVISVACAAVALLAFRRFSDQRAIARTKNLAQAHLLEVRLFSDEPILVLRAQRALLHDQGRLLWLLARPLLIVAVPMLLVLGQLEALYGRVPLRPGHPAVVNIKMSRAGEASLMVPDAVALETPPVRVDGVREISWRIRPTRPVSGLLRINVAGRNLTKSIRSEWKIGYTSERCVGSPMVWLIYPTEPPCSGVSRIELSYPRASILGLHWLLWFLLITTVAGLALRRPLGVAF